MDHDRATSSRPIDVLPASQYLQDRLQERRTRVARTRRPRHTDIGPCSGRDDDIFLNEAEDSRRADFLHSSPLASFNGRASASEAGSAGSGSNRRRALGIRDMDQHIDKLSKQNFDLKLELDHRREQADRLKEQIEDMRAQNEYAEHLALEHAELLKINSQLVDELEKRDRAVEEAMDIICDLEDRIAELEENREPTRPGTAQADSGYAGTEIPECATQPPPSPPEARVPKTPFTNMQPQILPASVASQKLQGMMATQTPPKARRQPIALSHQKPSNVALRSVVLESARELNPVKSFHSLLSRQESRADDDEETDLNSPRLSVLSESSFPSLYSPRHQDSPDRFPWEVKEKSATVTLADDPNAHFRQDSIKRVSQWISERDMAESTPSKSNSISAPLPDLIDSDNLPPPPPPPKHEHFPGSPRFQVPDEPVVHETPAFASPTVASAARHLLRPEKQRLRLQAAVRPNSYAGPAFGEPLLPPTPDSASTRMLRASQSTMVEDRTLLDTTPAPVKSFGVLEPGVRTAPRQMRSSVELSTAYISNLEYRAGSLVNRRESSSSDDEAYGEMEALPELGEFGMGGERLADLRSISAGSTWRDAAIAQSPPTTGNGFLLADNTRSPPSRRRSSAEINQNGMRPRLSRMETSPVFVGSLSRMAAANPKSSLESVTSPRSAHSGSSDTRTIVQTEAANNYAPATRYPGSASAATILPQSQQLRPISPEFSRRSAFPHPRSNSVTNSSTPVHRSRMSPSPARKLSQKTQNLFRRLSNSQGTDRDREGTIGSDTRQAGRIEWEKSPLLPTLTSTPASAYLNDPPRRPRTSHGDHGLNHTPRAPNSTTPRPPSSRGRRPSVQTRPRGDSSARIHTPVGSSSTLEVARGTAATHNMHESIKSSDGSAKDNTSACTSPIIDRDQDATPVPTPTSAVTKERKSLWRRSASQKIPNNIATALANMGLNAPSPVQAGPNNLSTPAGANTADSEEMAGASGARVFRQRRGSARDPSGIARRSWRQ